MRRTARNRRRGQDRRHDIGGLYAALDLGTNNCRLLIAEAEDDRLRVVRSFSRITRLGEGLAATGELAEPAMRRTLAALSACARLIRESGARRIRCVATEACRRARNGGRFVEMVERRTGIRLEILEPREEARLAMLGCMPLVDRRAEQVLLLDIGGGSTELFWMNYREPRRTGTCTLPVGVVTLSESWQGRDSEEAYRGMYAEVSRLLDGRSLPECLPNGSSGSLQMLGTSGTVTTLAALHLGLRRYDRRQVDGIVLSARELGAAILRLRSLSHQERARHPCIGKGRSDLVIAGCAILEALYDRWPAQRVHVADRGVREGILAEMAGRSLPPEARSG